MGSIRSQSWQCARSDWEANEDSPNQKEGVPFGGLETSLPSECEGFLLFLLHLAWNLHWDSNSEEICGGDGGSMKSQERERRLFAVLPTLSCCLRKWMNMI